MSDLLAYLKKYQIKEAHVHLLELIPLIEMIWADGKNQEAEIKLLYRFAIEHLGRLSQQGSQAGVVSEKEVNDFIDHFVKQRPDPEMLKDLKEACYRKLDKSPLNYHTELTKSEILDYCMDIAAACAKTYPYKFDGRIIQKEKDLLVELVEALQER